MYKAVRINNIDVKKVPLLHKEDDRPVKGSELFPEIYSNIFLCAKKKSGKTSAIYKIIKESVGRDTRIIAFVSTLYKDDNWKTIKKWCSLKGLEFEGHTSINEDGVDILDELVNRLQIEAKEAEEQAELNSRVSALEKKVGIKNLVSTMDDSDDDEDEKPKKKEKKRAPEYIIILDDLSNELKSRSLVTLLKKNRHFHAKIILSSQYLNDVLPEGRKQMDYFLVFRGIPEKKLDEIYVDAGININKKEFYDVYKFATEKEYSFLYIATKDISFRRNFNYKIEI